ncbi:MAG: DUF1579 family protein [Planctomycetota bacterium]|nr:DUF1579 family protein [Planctomycetota bacterium]
MNRFLWRRPMRESFYVFAILAISAAIDIPTATLHAQENSAADTKTPSVSEPDSGSTQPSKEVQAMITAEQGTWDVVMRVFPAISGAAVEEFKGTETNRPILDGLWLESTMECNFLGGKKFKGHGIFGYDSLKKKYVGTWYDNMSTVAATLEGEFDPETNTNTMTYETRDASGRAINQKHTTVYKEDGHKLFTIAMPDPEDATKFKKVLEVESKRRSSESKADPKKENAKSSDAKK